MSESGDSPTSSRESTPASQTPTPDKSISPSSPIAPTFILSRSFSPTSLIVDPRHYDVPELVKLARSKGAEVLNKYYTEDSNGMFFSNTQKALTAMSEAQWRPPGPDTTIPKTDLEDRAVVKRLVAAFLNLDIALDTLDNAYRKRFTPGTSVAYLPWTVERCAWEVLAMAKSIHTEGFKAPITDVDILKCIGQTENWTFEDRIGMICHVLKLSKSVAVSLMKQEKAWTVVGAPHKLFNSTIVNNVSNFNRNKWVKDGREAEKGHPVLPRSRKEGPAEKKRKTSHPFESRHGSATFRSSPLANAVSSSSNDTPSHESTLAAASSDVEMHGAVSGTTAEAKKEEHKVDELVAKMKAEADRKAAEEKVKVNIKANPKPKRKSDSTDAEMDNDNDNAKLTITNVAVIDDNATAGAQIERDQTMSPMSVTEFSPAPTTPSPAATTYTSATTAPADLDAAQLLLGLGGRKS